VCISWDDKKYQWMPQAVHKSIGDVAGQIYIDSRNSGEVEIMSIMMSISETLDSMWIERKFDDSFVNAWNVGNYASDYMMKRSGIEGCECNSEIVEPDI